jgi:dihydroneopterin aldolase
MKIGRFTLFLRGFEVQARIGIHDFERAAPQRLAIALEIDIDPSRLPDRDDIAETFDYDWVRAEVLRLVASRHFELQETLAQGVMQILAQRPEIVRAIVETAKPDVFPDVAAVGCRIEAQR